MLIEKGMSEKDSNNTQLSFPVSESRDHIQGPAAAAVTLVEYGDYECPYCAQAYLIVKEVQERLGSKVRFVFRNFPLTKLRPHAYQSALAVETAAAQGKFWEMADVILDNQQSLADQAYEGFAKQIGLNVDKFKADLKNKDADYEKIILDDMALGSKVGVRGTPSFYINGKMSGSRDVAAWKTEIDSLLK